MRKKEPFHITGTVRVYKNELLQHVYLTVFRAVFIEKLVQCGNIDVFDVAAVCFGKKSGKTGRFAHAAADRHNAYRSLGFVRGRQTPAGNEQVVVFLW